MSDLRHILQNRELVEELLEHFEKYELAETVAAEGSALAALEALAAGQESAIDSSLEAIVRTRGRPVLYIQDDKIQVPSELFKHWKKRLAPALPGLEQVLHSVGRIELQG